MADLDEIMSGSGADSVVDMPTQPPAQPEQRDDGRDEHGRFAPKQPPEAPQPEPQAEPQRPPDGYVPIQALDARLAKQEEKFQAQLRDRDAQIQRYMQQVQQPQKPTEPVKPPDYFENPDAAVDFRLKQAIEPLQQSQQGFVEKFSKALAIKDYGKEAVDAALAEMTDRVNRDSKGMWFDYQRIMDSDLPYDALVKWHRQQTALSKYGDDPEAAFNAEVERRLAERAGQQPQTQASAQAPPVLPTSFSGARSAGPSSAPAYSGPRPLSEIMPR
jgi:hypothetical protein